MAGKETINLSYIAKPSQRLQFFSELKGKMDGATSEFLAGFKMRFAQGFIVGYMNSNYKAFAQYTKMLEEGALRMEFNSMIDFGSKKP